MKQYAIIVAGGIGHRMDSKIPKQFLLINGTPLLMYTITAFYDFSPSIELVIVLPKEQMNFWVELCNKYQFNIPHKTISGGKARFESVRNGLETIGNSGFVAIHDGVRPLVSAALIKTCFDHALKYGNALPVLSVNESVRAIDNSGNKPIDRKGIRICQTPQVFLCEQIKKAYQQTKSIDFTDDASVLESLGFSIHLLPGHLQNIKITTPLDLTIAEAILYQKNPGN